AVTAALPEGGGGAGFGSALPHAIRASARTNMRIATRVSRRVRSPAVDKLTQEVVPILILLAVIAVVVRRLPSSGIRHSPEFQRRRILNWLPLGLTYAFLYMGRYN